MKTLSRKLFSDIRTLRMQILTMAVLVTCGVAVLVASWSSYESLQRARDNYYEHYQFADVFAEISRGPVSLIQRIQNFPDVDIVETRIVESALIDIGSQAEPALGRIISWEPSALLNKIHLRSGRFPEEGAQSEVLIHESFAKAHQLQIGDTLSLSVKGQKEKVIVSGIALSPEYVYAISPLSPFPDDKHFGVLWMHRNKLSRITSMEGAFNSLVIKMTPTASVHDLKQRLDLVLTSYGSLGSYGRDRQISNMFVEDEINQQKSMASVMPGIFLLVAAFILHTVLSRLIGLQRTQIAALKSMGYESLTLAVYYWKLVSVILALGIIPGLILAQFIGQGYAYLYEQYFRFPSIDFNLSINSILIGVAAGALPGWLASSLSLSAVFSLRPAEAMRPPAPANFNHNIFERWKILSPRSTQSKIVFRNVLVRPWRSVLSILGLAAATGILINGSFWSDIIEYMVDRQFYQISREDLEVQLMDPRGPEVLTELRRLPGVLLVEGTRQVGVRLRHLQHKEDTAIQSFDSMTAIRRVLNKAGQPLQIPEGQILVSRYFQDKLKLQRGDMLQFELPDKSGPNFQAVIFDFVDDVVGATVYANKYDLHRWLQETPSYNTLYLKIQPEFAERLYIQLKERPEVAAIGVKQLLYESFIQNLSAMILTFTAILVAFAVTITGAVLFNMARINLSEKAWELASLKIIGFNEQEVFRVLYLEMGLYVLLAMIPGLALGYGLSYLSTQWLQTSTFSYPLVIDIKTYALALVIMIATYLVTGLFLYRRVQTLNMTEALKARE